MRREAEDISARQALGVRRASFSVRDWLRESTASIARNAGRSLVTGIGTILGVAAFVATLGLSTTIGRQVSDTFDLRRATEVRVSPVNDDQDPAWQSPEHLAVLRGLNGVDAAGRRLILGQRPMKTSLNGTARSTELVGADPGALAVIGPHILLGRTFDDFHESRALAVTMLPSSIATTLGITRVGVAVFIQDRAFTVIGIFDDVARRPETLLAALIPASTAETLIDPAAQPQRDVVVATRPGAAQTIGAQAPYALHPEEVAVLHVVAPPDPKTLRQEVEGNVQASSLILSAVALVVGGISIANSATAAIAARTPEIGLRRAIGARPVHIFAQLVGETTAIGVMGGIVGVVLGTAALAIISLINGWVPVLSVRDAGVATVASAAFGLIAGLFPAARAMRIQPVMALQR